MSRPLQARIDLSALRNNLEAVRRRAPASRAMAVIKANGYGHGILRVARALCGADGFAVTTLEEAATLRRAGVEQPILLLEGFFGAADLAPIARYGLSVVVHHRQQIELLAHVPPPTRLDVFLKLNSGMNRLGFREREFGAALGRLKELPAVGDISLMTHFASAEEEGGIGAQLDVFKALTQGLPYPCSLANSAALLRYPEAHADWVRPGIMLYGASPLAERAAEELGLRPVMTLESEIIAVQRLAPGERVGYGGTFVAPAPMRIGVVACGYADGYPRHAPTGTPLLVEGHPSRTLGRVSMDMLCADLSDIPQAVVGSPVVLWGEGMPVEQVAHAAGTISYQLLCALAPRVPVREEH